MLCLLLLFFGLSRLQTDDDSLDPEKLRVQITVPEKIQSTISKGVESHVAYKIVIDGNTYTLNLTQKTFLPHNFRVYGYQGGRSMKPLEHNFQNLCYYQGFVEGFQNSMVIVSTCTGLRGLLQFENVTYGIEPLESSIGFEHVVYQTKRKNAVVSLYAEEIESRDLAYKIQSIKPVSEFSQYIEMHVVVEKKLYNHMGSDIAIVTEKIFQLIGLTNAIFTSFNITVILSSLEVWTDENKISTAGDANELLSRFLMWKKSYLVLRPHDVAFLLVYREKSNYVGATYQGKMCDRLYGGGVAMHPKIISLESLSVILAQLLSLNMGIPYDDSSKCQCSGAVCIMNPEAVHSSGMKIFSNCSLEDFAQFISKPTSQCLRNQPHLDPSFKSAVCGNGNVEQGEQCDCGSEEIKNKGELCRIPSDECDLPEYCNGTSPSCPEDLFIQNGHPCGGDQWICMEGRCLNGENQCHNAFGDDWKEVELTQEWGKEPTPALLSGVMPMSLGSTNGFKVCKNKKCVDDGFVGYDCDIEKQCNNNGICNNKKHCHCNPGYLPPDCKTEDPSWIGGSVESGNYPIIPTPGGRYLEIHYRFKPMKWPFFLLIPFFIVLVVLIAAVIKLHSQRKKWRAEEYISDE
ncbi:disintegrin and metalloproteinase domain-containing protein 2 [Rhynchocyon petersi]